MVSPISANLTGVTSKLRDQSPPIRRALGQRFSLAELSVWRVITELFYFARGSERATEPKLI